ncbi:hypothetical protein [Saccharothrix sp. Mg75]|uniref:hypothetical protein n=1 Tax=Saccharothrix sp. Mg75 TaxID=3445357 RepID=UPI003EEEB3BD
METVTLADRPDLADAVFAVPYPPGAARFVSGVLAASLVTRRRPAARWPHLVVALLDGGEPVARGVLVPYSGRGLSARVPAGMRRAVSATGYDSFLVPLRPPDKAAEPDVPMGDYAARTREDGLPADRWLRTHVRAGGVVEGVARCSSSVVAPLAVWRDWTGLPFDRDGDVRVPGGLAPVRVSVAHDVAVYVEADVRLRHPADGATGAG